MSFKQTKLSVDEGDVIILYFGPTNMHSIEVKRQITNKKGELVDNTFQTTYGALKVIDLVGKEYGSKVQLTKGFGYVLQPTPELWTLTLPHRTQIIYTADISLIIHLLDLRPGSVVIESGTGSGSLSHALIRTVRPSGHLYTFDFHENRVNVARDEFQVHGLDEFVTVGLRDVCSEGFGDDLKNKADAIFLDLPHPWKTIDFAVDALKESGGKLCSFSPCIEQVQRTCEKLAATGFEDIKTYENLQTELQVHYKSIPILDLESLKDEEINGEPAKKKGKSKIKQDENKILTVSEPKTLPGHTGYITIATLPPEFARSVILES